MKVSTSYERLTRQTFVLDEGEIGRAVEAHVRQQTQLWAKVPAGCVESIQVEFGNHDEGAVYAELTRTFVKVEDSEPQS